MIHAVIFECTVVKRPYQAMLAPEWGMRAKVRANKQELEAGVYAAVFCVYWPAAEHGPTELETCWHNRSHSQST